MNLELKNYVLVTNYMLESDKSTPVATAKRFLRKTSVSMIAESEFEGFSRLVIGSREDGSDIYVLVKGDKENWAVNLD